MKAILTGTGTSQGVPVIGCRCPVCTSSDTRDQRLRTAAFVQSESTNIAIDAGPDFRRQMLNVEAKKLDALILTHEHNDHVAGIDDIRPFNFMQGSPLRVYAMARVSKEIKERFAYIFHHHAYPGAPSVDLVEIEPYVEFKVGDVSVIPFIVQHGDLPILGLKVGKMAYITDANALPTESLKIVSKAEVVVLNALHHKRHHSHFNLEQALALVEKLDAKQVLLTHISHMMGLHAEVNASLPTGVQLAFDGLVVKI